MTMWILKTLHHWFGVAFAAFFFVIAISGVWVTLDRYIAATLFIPEFRASVQELSPEETAEKLGSVSQAYAPDGLLKVETPTRGRAAYKVTFKNGETVYLNQGSLSPIPAARSGEISQFMRRLHVTLLGAFGIGHQIVVWTGLIGIVLAVMGYIIAIPQLRSFRKDRLLLPKEISFRDVRRTHLSSGVAFGAFVIFFGFTGWCIGEPDEAGLVMRSFDGSAERPTNFKMQNMPPELQISLDDIALQSAKALPDHLIRQIEFGEDESAGLIFVRMKKGRDFSSFGHSRIGFERQSGTVAFIDHGEKLGAGTRIVNAAFRFHSGYEMGIIYQIVLCVIGLVTALLSAMGLLSYCLKWKRKLSKLKMSSKVGP